MRYCWLQTIENFKDCNCNLKNDGRVFAFRVDPFSKKDWYDVKAPSMFNIRQIGKTLVTRTIGTSKLDVLLYFSAVNS